MLPLSTLVEVNPRDSVAGDLPPDAEVSFVPMSAVSEVWATIERKETRRLSEVRRGYTAFREGDVLWAKITPCMENGKLAIATGLAGHVGFGSTEFHVLRVKPGAGLHRRLLYFWLRQPSLRRAAQASMRGAAGQRRVPEEFLLGQSLPRVQAEEQARIVELLDEADALRRLRAKADARAERIVPAIFEEMFVELRCWPTVSLGARLDFMTSGSRGWAEYYKPSGDLFLRIQNVRGDALDLEDCIRVAAPEGAEAGRTRVAEGDVLVSITADLGRSAAVPKLDQPAYINQHLALLRSRAFNAEYLASWIASRDGQEQILRRNRQAAKAGLNFDDLRGLRVPEPPLNLQEEYARRKLEARAIQHGAAASRAKLDALFDELLRRAFTGELTARWRAERSAPTPTPKPHPDAA